MTWTKFTEYWNSTLRKFQEPNARVFEVLRGAKSADGANGVGLNIPHLTHTDFRSVLRCVLDTHPGLEFLKDSPEFQDRYLETVTYRIFYQVNVAWNGRMTLRELRRSNLVEAMTLVDEEEDINKVLKYFSYEHFYVVYCKFWELDTDHDFLIDKEDLLRYGNHALTYRAVDRVSRRRLASLSAASTARWGTRTFAGSSSPRRTKVTRWRSSTGCGAST